MRISFFSFFLSISIFGFAQYRNIEIQAAGLTCSLCSNAIQKALKGLPFVASVKTELKSNTFLLDLRPGVPIDFDAISRKVEDAGFSVGALSVEVKFNNVNAKNDVHTQVGNQLFHFLAIEPQNIEGWQKVRLLDKNFVLAAEAKKNSKLTAMPCYKTGMLSPCCQPVTGIAGVAAKRVYHITL